jgi:hypothetical protein
VHDNNARWFARVMTHTHDTFQGKAECAGSYVLGAAEVTAARESGETVAISDSVHVGFLVPNAWAPPRDNFDSVPTAIMTLAQCMLFKWMAPMQGAKDATAVDVSPNYDSNMMSSLFFVIFIIACGFFGFNLVLAFVVDAYHISKGTEECDRLFARFIQQIEIVRPQSDRGRLPSNRHSTYLRRIFYSQAYAKFVLTCIVVSGVLNLATHSSGHGSSLPDDHDTFELVMEVQQFVFDIELLLEVMLGLVALGPRAYFSKGWMMMDFFMASGSVLSIISRHAALDSSDKAVLRASAMAARNMRVLRVLRALSFLKLTRSIVRTLISCVPKLGNVLVLVVLFYSIIAAIAVHWFGMIRNGYIIGPSVNVETFVQAGYLCFSCAFGGEWHLILRDLMVSSPECSPEGPGVAYSDCGNSFQAIFLIFGIKIFAEGMLVNLSIGMILDNFNYITDGLNFKENDSWSAGASNEQVEALAAVFCRFDNGTGYLPLTALKSFLIAASRPMGFHSSSIATAGNAGSWTVEGGVQDPWRPGLERGTSSLTLGALVDSNEKLTAEEIASYKLIRAELNVMLWQKRKTRLWQKKGQQDLISPRSPRSPESPQSPGVDSKTGRLSLDECFRFMKRGKQKRSTFVAAVSFEELLTAILVWRIPHMVPTVLRQTRKERLEQVSLVPMPCALNRFPLMRT